MSHYRPYPVYKDSGVEWLGMVPEHWELRRLKFNFRLISEKAEHRTQTIALENIESWTGRYIQTDTEFEGDGIAFKIGDILFGKLRPYLAKVYLANSSGEAVGDVFVIRPGSFVYPAFAQYQFLSNEFIKTVDGSTYGAKMPRVSWDFFSDMPLCTPSVEEQKVVVQKLDSETARIDALVSKKTRFIELLREKRQALITQAVTKGLDPNVKMKDSRVEWLGDVPEHWQIKQIKYLATHIGSGKTPSGGAEVYQDSGVIFLRSQNIHDDGIRLEDVAYITEEVDQDMRGSRVFQGDILLNITGASIGRSCMVADNIGQANVNQHVCIVRIIDKVTAVWVAEYFLSTAIKAQIDFSQNGAGREGLNFEQIGNMVIALPPVHEELSICKMLSTNRNRLDTLISKTEHSIELLKERRSALITAAVTGQLDLREAV
ncbi:restriction endonuclease subunit S [Methylomonas paludis]|uniref:Restriction endonuclease subunit S n=1 Tax=Methylomonas paludis TaxID=1173101 RepID=A0A975RB56_9GAMM|nr:restriction endonuclease subunit S [Methylomonas paludis]QWF72019.1 restriction endonuclease subunit S [Methylomonas paludis]